MSGLDRSDVYIPNKPKIISKLNLVNHEKYIPTFLYRYTQYDSVHCTRNTITILLGKKKSEDFQGFFSKTLLIFGGRRCRSPYSIFIRHSDIELEQTSVSCCFRIFEAKNQANLYQYISKSSCPKVCRSVLKNQFCILYITSLSSHPNNIGNSIGSRHI